MVYCEITDPGEKVVHDLGKYWPDNYIWQMGRKLIVAVNEVFTDDLGPYKKLYLILTIDRFKIDYTIPYNEFKTYKRRLTI